MTQKPHITKERSVLFGRKMLWFCRGLGRMGSGDTPKSAYWAWQWLTRNKGDLK